MLVEHPKKRDEKIAPAANEGKQSYPTWTHLFLVDLFPSVCNFVSDDGTDIFDHHTSLYAQTTQYSSLGP